MDSTAKPQARYEIGSASGRVRKGEWKGKLCLHPDCQSTVSSRGLCRKHYQAEYWASGRGRIDRAKRRDARLKHRYGISGQEYDAMVEAQGGRCAVCREFPSQENTRAHWSGKLCIDHCHETGRIRGLLCNDCNLTVGYGKSAAILSAAAEYVRLHYG